MNVENREITKEIMDFLARNKKEYFSIREIASEVNGNFYKVASICTALASKRRIKKTIDNHGMNVYKFKRTIIKF
jgi:predicted AAA+ superfamily ATPase